MSKKPAVLRSVFLILTMCLLVSAPFKADGAIAQVNTYDDEFDGDTLDPKWSIINEENKEGWSLTANPGCIRITTLQGEFLHVPADAQNVILQKAPAGDWAIVTKVTGVQGKPKGDWAQAGLIVYQDDDYWFKMVRLHNSLDEYIYKTNNLFQIGREKGGFHEWYQELTQDNIASATVYLKIVKRGNEYSGYFSEDGVTFTQVGKAQTLKLTKIKIGLLAFNGSDFYTPESMMDFDFDFFHLTRP